VATLIELKRRSARHAFLAQCAGLGLVVGGVVGLVGVWWGMITAGLVIVAAGVLREAGWF
jgi:hypothetical protein